MDLEPSPSNNDTDDDDFPAHDLFIDARPSQMRRLHTVRVERDGERSAAYSRDDLVDWSDVIRRFGGGAYRAVGFDVKSRPICWYPPKGEDAWVMGSGIPPRPLGGPRRGERVKVGARVGELEELPGNNESAMAEQHRAYMAAMAEQHHAYMAAMAEQRAELKNLVAQILELVRLVLARR